MEISFLRLYILCCFYHFSVVGPILYFDLLNYHFLQLSNGPNQRALPSPQIRESEGVADAQFQNHDEASCGQPTTSFGVACPSGCGSALGIGNRNNNDVGPFGIPDLNLPIEEEDEEFMGKGVECCEALDNKNNVNRALAAQARQKRIQICRLKNPRNSCR